MKLFPLMLGLILSTGVMFSQAISNSAHSAVMSQFHALEQQEKTGLQSLNQQMTDSRFFEWLATAFKDLDQPLFVQST